MGALFRCGALLLVGRPPGRPRALTAAALKAEAGVLKFRQSEAALKPRLRTQVDKGVLRTAGSKLTFAYFCSATKVGPAGGETAYKSAGCIIISDEHRIKASTHPQMKILLPAEKSGRGPQGPCMKARPTRLLVALSCK